MHATVRVQCWAGCRVSPTFVVANFYCQCVPFTRLFGRQVAGGTLPALAAVTSDPTRSAGCSRQQGRAAPVHHGPRILLVRNVNIDPPCLARGVPLEIAPGGGHAEYAIPHPKVRDVVLCGTQAAGRWPPCMMESMGQQIQTWRSGFVWACRRSTSILPAIGRRRGTPARRHLTAKRCSSSFGMCGLIRS